MALQTFTWCATGEATGQVEYRTATAQFGDGYAQNAADGINNKQQSWPLTFKKRSTEAAAIMAFFDEHAGYKAFAWKPPLGVLGLYLVKNPTIKPMGAGWYEIAATFEQAFHP